MNILITLGTRRICMAARPNGWNHSARLLVPSAQNGKPPSKRKPPSYSLLAELQLDCAMPQTQNGPHDAGRFGV
ncbi:hypothetical protein, partial [Mesorhizobium sp.]